MGMASIGLYIGGMAGTLCIDIGGCFLAWLALISVPFLALRTRSTLRWVSLTGCSNTHMEAAGIDAFSFGILQTAQAVVDGRGPDRPVGMYVFVRFWASELCVSWEAGRSYDSGLERTALRLHREAMAWWSASLVGQTG